MTLRLVVSIATKVICDDPDGPGHAPRYLDVSRKKHMTKMIMMAFSVEYDDSGIDQIIRDFGGTDVGQLIVPELKCSLASAERLCDSLRYESVHISKCAVNGENAMGLWKKQLKGITINGATFTQIGNPFDGQVNKLANLDFSDTNLDEHAVQSFIGRRAIQRISCGNTNATIEVIRMAVKMPCLKQLNVGGNQFGLQELMESGIQIPRGLNVML